MQKTDSSSKIGTWISTALVLGNMIGSGIFLLPATLAAYGGISLIFAVIGSGQEVVYWGFILLILGIPFYIYIKRKGGQ